MPQPPQVQAITDELLDLYRAAQTHLLDELVRAGADLSGTSESYRRRLAGLVRAVDEELLVLDDAARTWASGRLPGIYQLGGEQAAAAVDRRFEWTSVHRGAVQHLAGDVYDDLLKATRYVRRDTKAFIRVAARERAAATLLEGRTARQAGRDLERHLRERGINAVTYRNGARHGLADYADTVIRTKSAVSYNHGALNSAQEYGIKWVRLNDGPDCGLERHDSPDKANGSVRTIEEAQAYPIGHPRCARSVSPLPAESIEEAKRLAAGEYNEPPAVSVPTPTTATSHEQRLAQREARLEARAEKVRA